MPDVLGPMRSDRCDKKGLVLDESEDKILVHSKGAGGLSVGVTGSLELVESRLEGSLVPGSTSFVNISHR